jgi:hypothetical protein
MADVLKFENKARPRGEEIPAALRDFIDTVIVPALVKDYLAEENDLNILAPINGCVADSAAMQLGHASRE